MRQLKNIQKRLDLLIVEEYHLKASQSRIYSKIAILISDISTQQGISFEEAKEVLEQQKLIREPSLHEFLNRTYSEGDSNETA